MSILHEIFAHKKQELAREKAQRSLVSWQRQIKTMPAPPSMAAALRGKPGATPRLIAEIKRKSPSRGLLRPNLNPEALAQTYVQAGAAAISVLTDAHYFGGSLEILQQVAALNLSVPLLRKDFLFDAYQLFQARGAGASAVLLIVAMLSASQLQELLDLAHDLDMMALVECHTAQEMETALAAGARLIGVNNRNLHTFEVNLETCLALRPQAPADILFVAESGIHTAQDVARLAQASVDAMLIGEALVTHPQPERKIQHLLSPQSERAP